MEMLLIESKPGNKNTMLIQPDPEIVFITLRGLVAKQVSVFCSVKQSERNGFHTQICICGELEYNEDRDQFRVLSNEGTYAYFKMPDINYLIKHHSEFRDGSKACIGLTIETKKN